jgi:hypothetical protein
MDRMGHERSELAETGATGGTGEDRLPDRVASLVDEVTRDQRPPSRRRLTGLLQDAARGSARSVGRSVRATHRATRLGAGRGIRWLTGQVLAMAPRLPIRDEATLRAQFAGLSPEEVADALIEGASRASAAVGAAVGAWSVLPVVPAVPVEVATETLALVGIEIKLIAELHEVYGMRAPGRAAERMTAYVAAWANRGGVALAPGGLIIAIGSPLYRRLQRRLAVRAGRSAFSLLPLFTGAAAGGLFNRAETRRLGREIRDDLRRRSPIAAHWAAPPPPQGNSH